MRIADRYIGWQIFFGTIFAVFLLTVILVMSQVVKEVRPYLVEQGAPLSLLAKFVIYVIPLSLMFTLPWGFLASVLLGFGRLSSNHELISLRMAGLSLTRVAAPVLILGFLFSCLSYYIVGTVAPNATAAGSTLPYQAASRDPKVFLNPGVVQATFPGKKVYIEGRDGERLRGFHIYQFSDDTRHALPTSYIHANEVDLRVDMEKKQFVLTLNGTHIETYKDDGTVELAMAAEAEPWLIDWSNTKKRRAKVSELTNTGIAEQLRDPETPPELQKELNVELHQRRSLSFACLAFALIGIPLGINGQRKETSWGLLASFVVAVVYFGGMLFIDPLKNSSQGLMVGMIWLPNILCLILGIWLFCRASLR